jgi:hypothetical protein
VPSMMTKKRRYYNTSSLAAFRLYGSSKPKEKKTIKKGTSPLASSKPTGKPSGRNPYRKEYQLVHETAEMTDTVKRYTVFVDLGIPEVLTRPCVGRCR